MTGLVLKLIAMGAMLIDHITASSAVFGLFRGSGDLYQVLRCIGRPAFPIFGFLLVEGARYTKNKRRYFFRLIFFAAVSEIPFDLALFGNVQYPRYQNVFFTLALGLLTVYMIQYGSRLPGKMKILGWGGIAGTVFLTAFVAEKVLFSDYGAAGVLMIAVMGLMNGPFEELRVNAGSDNVYRLLFALPALVLLARILGDAEWWGLIALIPIGLYNGKKGYENKVLQWSFYLFYPCHLLFLAAAMILQR